MARPANLFIISLIFTFFALSGFLLTPLAFTLQPDEIQAQEAINVAQAAINTAVGELALAERAGAQISDLVNQLNIAVDSLVTARRALNTSDYSSAVLYAEDAQQSAHTVSGEALNRRTLAQASSILQVILPITALALIIVLSYLLLTQWQKYQQRQKRELLRMEIRLPEQEDESESHE